jgi:hypothetical protein
MGDELNQFFLFDSILQRVNEMKVQLVRAIQGDQRRDGGEAPIALRERWALPHITKQDLISEVNQFGAKSPISFCMGEGAFVICCSLNSLLFQACLNSRSLRCVARCAETARKAKTGHPGRDDSKSKWPVEAQSRHERYGIGLTLVRF